MRHSSNKSCSRSNHRHNVGMSTKSISVTTPPPLSPVLFRYRACSILLPMLFACLVDSEATGCKIWVLLYLLLLFFFFLLFLSLSRPQFFFFNVFTFHISHLYYLLSMYSHAFRCLCCYSQSCNVKICSLSSRMHLLLTLFPKNEYG